jgi:hypothetical protein
LDWTTPIFRFVGDDESKAVVVHAAGIYNGFGGDLTPDEVAQLKKARIFRTEAWRENLMAKLSYAFAVVDNANISSGVQIAIETSLLGDKVKGVINDAMMEAEDDGNPYVNPYAIQWRYLPNEKEHTKKYAANKMGKIPFTDQIRKLIVETPPPNLERLCNKRDPGLLKAQLQDACLIEGIPWDEILSPAEKEWASIKKAQEEKNADFNPAEIEAQAEKAQQSKATVQAKPRVQPMQRARQSAPTKVQPKAALFCVSCGEPISSGDELCASCGEPVRLRDKVMGKKTDNLPY